MGIRVKWNLDKALRWELPGCGGLKVWASCQAERIPDWERRAPLGGTELLGHLELQEAAILPEGSTSERLWGGILQVFETLDAGLRNPRKVEQGSWAQTGGEIWWGDKGRGTREAEPAAEGPHGLGLRRDGRPLRVAVP